MDIGDQVPPGVSFVIIAVEAEASKVTGTVHQYPYEIVATTNTETIHVHVKQPPQERDVWVWKRKGEQEEKEKKGGGGGGEKKARNDREESRVGKLTYLGHYHVILWQRGRETETEREQCRKTLTELDTVTGKRICHQSGAKCMTDRLPYQ